MSKNEAIHEFRVNPSLERNVGSNWHYEVHPLITFVTVIFVHVIAKITFYESKSQTSSKTFPENSVFGIMSLTVSLENSSMRILWVPFQFLWNIWSGARLYHQKTHPDQAFSATFVLDDFSTNRLWQKAWFWKKWVTYKFLLDEFFNKTVLLTPKNKSFEWFLCAKEYQHPRVQ